ncbi:PIR Superfamily Protein [Plasmodium ovale curtisi]|uniref:PIR Superfamily Protein n=1 Tax=Plasmodium ovale curtisi TaxID=864141 RepID=A0A1A8WLC1_PLAOA|nr:PIR Superfamily Protein [Plasmodium ovale curtisi]
MGTGGIQVHFNISGPRTKLSRDDCIVLFVDIPDEFQNIISQLDKTEEETDLFISKCKELKEYTAHKKKKYPECFEGDLLHIYSYTEQELNNLLQKSLKYSKCNEKLNPTSKEPVVLEQQKDACNQEKDGMCVSAATPLEKRSETKAECDNGPCTEENSQCNKLIVSNQGNGDTETTCKKITSLSTESVTPSRNLETVIPAASEDETLSRKNIREEETSEYIASTWENKQNGSTGTYSIILKDSPSVTCHPDDQRYVNGLDIVDPLAIDVFDNFITTKESSAMPQNPRYYIYSESPEDINNQITFTIPSCDVSTSTAPPFGEKPSTEQHAVVVQNPSPVKVLHDKGEKFTAKVITSKDYRHSPTYSQPIITTDPSEADHYFPTVDISETSSNSNVEVNKLKGSTSKEDQLLSVEREVENGIYSLPPHADQDGIPIRTYIIIIVVILAILLLLLLLFKVMQKLCLKCISNFSIIIHFN